ncbi:paraquat-inducible protein A [Pseudotenacibaculum sp. MALMAid0570]|uniref:paraquat-inducible protein A n=1 Tax=Pseudotenacibaculum sp. MALMAid0570 TaxID=3143938 RepID=UPI0032E0018D
MKALRLIFLTALLAVSAFFGYKTYQQEKQNQTYHDHLVELQDIKYGLFNVDEWKEVFAGLIAKKMDDFNIANTDEEAMKKEISAFLGKAIDNFEKRYNEENKGGGITSLLKRSISSFAGIFEQVRKDIPIFTDEIYSFLTEGGSREMLQKYLEDQLDTYTKDTFLATDYTALNNIINKYEAKDKTDAVVIISKKIEENNSNKNTYNYILLALFIVTILSLIFFTAKTKVEFLLFTLYSILLLSLGIFLPMIAIDARIEELNFPFLGETIQFKDQVLFYKSKSIMEVVDLMISQNRFDLLFVGILVLLFSVLFPVSKLLASIGYVFSSKLKNNRVIKFFVFKTGKWSMADVFVIALFMAYLGFDGLITEQLNQLQSITKSTAVLTTNNSGLLFGFYAFTAFVLVSIFISQKVEKLKS